MTSATMTMPRAMPVPVAACLVLEVRWGQSRLETRSLRSGRLFADVELAPLIDARPGAVLADQTPHGFCVYAPSRSFMLSIGERVSWTVGATTGPGAFHVEARVDQVISAGSMAWLARCAMSCGGAARPTREWWCAGRAG